MEITNTQYLPTREAWREWLKEHYRSEAEIWLIFYRKETGKANIPYNTAVEEALCFGWIDSIRKNLDQDRYVHRFTPRKPGSGFSQTNKERLKKLIEGGRVMPDVLETLEDFQVEDFKFPEDIMADLRENEIAWKNFQKYSGSYQRIRVAFIDSARNRPEEFEKRLKHFINMTEQDKQYGYGIEAYY